MILPKFGTNSAILVGIQRGTKVNYHPETPKKAAQYIFGIILMAVQFYAHSSLFSPLYPDYMLEMAREALITRGYKRGVTRICHPIAVRTQGGLRAEGRTLEFRNFLLDSCGYSRIRPVSFFYNSPTHQQSYSVQHFLENRQF